MFQGCAKVFFRSYPIAPQNKKKGVVPVLRSAQNRHNTLFLAGEVFGTDGIRAIALGDLLCYTY